MQLLTAMWKQQITLWKTAVSKYTIGIENNGHYPFRSQCIVRFI